MQGTPTAQIHGRTTRSGDPPACVCWVPTILHLHGCLTGKIDIERRRLMPMRSMSVMHAYSVLNEPANHTDGQLQAHAHQASRAALETETVGRHCRSSLAPKSRPQRRKTHNTHMIPFFLRPFKCPLYVESVTRDMSAPSRSHVCKNSRQTGLRIAISYLLPSSSFRTRVFQ